MEIWKPIEGTNGLYEVSNMGKVRSTNYRNTNETKVMVATPDKKGYLRIRIKNKHFKWESIKVHREVAKAFIPNPCMKPHVNHINGNKADNRADNLEWVTAQENADHAMKNGLWQNCLNASKMANEKRKTAIIATNLQTGEKIRFSYMREAEEYCNTKHINEVIKGKRKQANGYCFAYDDRG